MVPAEHKKTSGVSPSSQSNALFRALAENSQDHILRFDPQLRLIYANQNALKLLKMTDTGMGKTFGKINFPEHLNLIFSKAIPDVLANGKSFKAVIEWSQEEDAPTTFDWQIFPEYSSEQEIISLLLIARDITEPRRSLARASALASILETSLNEIYIFAADNLKFIEVNKGARDNLGYTAGELLQMTPVDIKPEISAEKFTAIIAPLLDGQEEKIVFETVHLRKNGSQYNVEVHLQLTTFETSQVFIAFILDITERKKVEAALLKHRDHLEELVKERTFSLDNINERLRQAEKMEAIGQLAGGIAHDFNNRLVPIQGFAQLLYEEVNDEQHRDFASRIVSGAKRVARLTEQILTFAKRGEYEFAPTNIHELIAEVISFLEHSIDKCIEIRKELTTAPATVLGDPSRLQNALLNLAINARDAMPGGGKLIFKTMVVEHEANKDATADLPADLSPGQYLRIDVADNGTGMDKETQRHIFEPFFTTKQASGGSGMGLATVYGIVQSHHGEILIESQPDLGSTFSLYLPMTKHEGVAPDIVPPTSIKKQARVLIIDDEEDVCAFSTITLQKHGCSVTSCVSGHEALMLYQELWTEFDVVILDMVMPEMNGRDVFQELKKVNPLVKVIICSGHDLTGENPNLLEGGARGFLRKPFEPNELTQIVADTLRGDQ